MKRLTPPIEVCDAFVPKEIPWDVVLPWAGVVLGVVAVFAITIAVLVCIWLMPRSAKQ